MLMLRLMLFITWTTICTRAQLVGLLFPGSSVSEPSLGKPCHTEAHQGVCVKREQCGSAISYIGVNQSNPCGPTAGFDIICCGAGNTTRTADVLDVSLPDVINPEVNEEAQCAPLCGTRVITINEDIDYDYPPMTEEERKFTMEELSRINSGRPSGDVVPEVHGYVGGFEPGPSTWPWMALLGKQRPGGSPDWQCTGTVIRYGREDKWIITAAHCFNDGTLDIVRLGEHNYTDDSETVTSDHWIEKIIVHPEYSVHAGYHDMALIKLSRFPTDINMNMNPFVRPICLPWGEKISEKLVGEKAYAAGWGSTEFDGSKSPILQEAHITIFNSSICDEKYKKGDLSRDRYETHYPDGVQAKYLLCAGHPDGGIDACKGDSGGPLMILPSSSYVYYLAGVVSHGWGCGLKEYPGVYTPLHNPVYLAWIKKNAFNPGETDSFC